MSSSLPPAGRRVIAAVDPKAVPPPPAQRFVTLPNGLELACQSPKETDHLYEDIFEHRVYLSHGIELRDGACVFDVGGNIGLFTIFLHQSYRDLVTYTFEPAPPLFELLHFNTARHGGRCKLFQCGISDRLGTASLTFYPYSSGMSSFYGNPREEREVLQTLLENQSRAGDAGAAVMLQRSEDFLDARLSSVSFECPLVPLSRIIRQEGVETIDLLKIDVQKSEVDVLAGIEPEDWPKIRQIAMEVHDLDGQLGLVRDLLARKGFDVVTEQDPLYRGSVMHNLYAVRKGASRRASAAAAGEARPEAARPVAFLFSGIGDHYVGMGLDLYDGEPVFRAAVDECAEILRPLLDLDIREVLYPAGAGEAAGDGRPDLRRMLGRGQDAADPHDERLGRTGLLHPALFTVEHALARQWGAWGVRPEAVIGYSIGEYAAACLAGVFSLEGALRLVARRARVIECLPAGAMLAVSLPEREVSALLGEARFQDLSLAAVNGPAFSVVSGAAEDVAALAGELAEGGVVHRRLRASHPFHSRRLEPARPGFLAALQGVELAPPELPLLSNVTGTWITDEQATDPGYWADHMLRTVRFGDGLSELLRRSSRLLVEIGPGQSLCSIAIQSADAAAGLVALPSLPAMHERRPERAFLRASLDRLRSAAGEPPVAGGRPGAPKAAPRTEVEAILRDLFQEVLGRERVGIHDNFFDLGGNSLTATRLISRLWELFGMEVSLRTLFEAPTAAELGAAIVRVEALPPLGSTPPDQAPVLSFGQERLWLLHQMAPGEPVYNVPMVLRWTGPLDAGALVRTLQALLDRHEVLRTAIETRGQDPVPVVRPARAALPAVDLGAIPPGMREAAAQRLCFDETRRPFDLGTAPLLRSLLLRLDGESALLVLTLHHIACDGWSRSILLRELAAVYQDCARGRPPSLPAPERRYADFAAWQRSWLQGETLAGQLGYWRAHLEGAPRVELAPDRPRPVRQTTRGARAGLHLSAEVSDRLREIGRHAGATLFVTLLGAFDVLLSRCAGSDDLVVGAPIAGRRHRESDGLVGFFVNVLALRVRVEEDLPFERWLRHVREVVLDGLSHQDLPFEMLVEALQPERQSGRNPICPVMFALQDLPSVPPVPGLALELLDLATGTAKFDCALHLYEGPERLSGYLEYATDLFETATAARLAACFRTLAAGVAADPERPLAALSLLGEAELHQVLVEWNATEKAIEASCIHRIFEARVEAAPGAEAVVYQDRSLTYGELNARANQLAHRLRRHGVGPESLVAIAMDRSLEMAEGVLGIVKAGAAFLPLDPGFPPERLASILESVGTAVLVTAEPLVAKLGLKAPLVVCLDREREELAAESRENPDSGVLPDHLAYVIFTSGSTGRPKGVAISHRALCNHFLWMRDSFPLGPGDRVLRKTPFSFDVSVSELFDPLAQGACLVMAEPGSHRDAAQLLRLAREQAVTMIPVVPLQLQGFLEQEDLETLTALRRVQCGGEALASAVQKEWVERMPGALLLNLYGPAETAIDSSWWLCREVGPWLAAPIGRPVDNARIHLLDARMRPVPIGVAAELYVGGAGLGRGYWERPELTAERFLPDPVSGEPGARLYRSGDLARFLPDGNLEFLDRLDFQVKVRGLRIELGEIESVLRAHPAVEDGAVAVHTAASGDRHLTAYVVSPRPLGEIEEALRGHVAERLPDYMVPAFFVALDRLPQSASGKLDRRTLPAPVLTGATVAPRSPAELKLARIFREVLRVERVGVHDDFFRLGGHSLLASRVMSRVHRDFQVDLPLRTLFEGPTIAALARRVAAAERTLPLSIRRVDGAGPLSYGQQRLWFLCSLMPGNPLYNVAKLWRWSGRLDVRALRGSLDEIVRRHEVLRTRFVSRDGEPAQQVAPASGMPLLLADLSGLGPETREAEAGRLAAAEAVRAFRLDRDPPARALLLRLAPEEHRLLVALHHIASDGWSMEVLVHELTALYAAFAAGRPSPLPELAAQYADFAAWQRDWLDGERLQRLLSYWQAQLAGVAPLDLAADRPRPALRSYDGGWIELRLGARLVEGLQAVSQARGATLFMALLAAFQALLHRYTGQPDVVVGSPVANRNHPAFENLIGFFVNVLALRSDLSADPAYREVLDGAVETALAAYDHQDLPFERLVEHLQPERDLSRNPIVQVLFALHSAAGLPGAEPADLEILPLPLRIQMTHFDLEVHLREAGDVLEGRLVYGRDLFEATTMRRLARHLEALLAGAALEPGRRISELPMLAEAERRQLLEWSEGPAAEAPGCLLHELFERQAVRTPERLALSFGGEELSYADLDARANRLARLLRHRGVGAETVVGICLERGVEMVVSLLAVLKAGGAYLPLDPDHPPERLSWMVEDSGAALVLTRETFPPRELIERERAESPSPLAFPESLAYLIYTSGSTGRPKGVELHHRGAVSFLAAMRDRPGLDEGDTVLALTTISFDISVLEIFLPLSVGARVALADRATAADGRLLASALEGSGATVVQATPATWQMLLAAGWTGRSGLKMLSGGEALKSELARDLLEPGGSLWNVYGPTEATVWATVHEVDGRGAGVEPIGRPIAGVRARVLDAGLGPVPAGVPGELFLGGVQVARGYRNQPAQTAERFVPDPWSGVPGSRLYRTGDRARVLADGCLEFLGRLDHQVKIRGFRIELGEVEAALLRHPAVREAVVVAQPDPAGSLRLVAYVVFEESERRRSSQELKAFLGETLPSYMVPSLFVELERLPLTPSGKVDRRRLPAPEAEKGGRTVAPRDRVEAGLARIWEEVLGTGPVGAGDNFFDLGGHSLLATRVTARIRQEMGLELPVRALFEAPTVAELAGRIRALHPELVRPRIVPVPREGALPLSFAQQRLWVLDQLRPGSAVYNVPAVWRFSGPLDVAVLRRSLAEIVRRHEALRTRFPAVGGQPVQQVEAPGEPPLRVIDLSALPGPAGEAALQEVLAQEVPHPFHLAAGLPLRLALVRLGQGDHALAVTMHHIASDEWSVGVFFAELAALYEAIAAGRPSPLAELPVQYADYAVWQRGWLVGDVLDRQLSYWEGELAEAANLDLPTDRPRPAVQLLRGGKVSFQLPEALLRSLRSVGRRRSASPFMILLAAFQVLLHRHSGQPDVVVGAPVANRDHRELEGLIGLFLNTLALHGRAAGNAPFSAFLAQVRETVLAAFAYQDLPFERVVDHLQVERDLSRNPIFQVVVDFHNAAAPARRMAGLGVQRVPSGSRTTRFDLELHLGGEEEGMWGLLAYDTDLFDEATIERMAGHYRNLLHGIAGSPEQLLSRLPLLGEAEQNQMLLAWNDVRFEYDRQACLHELFQARAELSPEAVAVLDADRSLTYGEVDAWSNRLAHRLIGLGVGAETRVGVCIDRSPEMVVALLGVLKAGGAYVPVDPAYPRDRIALILEDVGALLCVTRSALAAGLAGLASRPVCVDADALAGCSAENPPRRSGSGNTAYVIFTSGSTGRPKGVVLQHRPVVNLIEWVNNTFDVGPADRVLQVASICFDLSVYDVFGLLAAGGSVRVASEEELQDPGHLARLLDSGSITFWDSAPAALQQLVPFLPAAGEGSPGLRLVFLSGDWIPLTLPAALRRSFPDAEVVALGGATEAAIWSNFHAVREVRPEWASIPYGRAIQNARYYVLDEELQPCPIGVAGDLYIGGECLSLGYFNRPRLTAERYIPDPYGDRPGGVLYATGDRARWKAAGHIEFLGRLDAQVKIRGYRIELGEIEAALSEHPAVRHAVALVREDQPGVRRLVAYAAGSGDAGLAEELRAQLKSKLPSYMVPSAVVTLAALPLTPNGKVDRKALPAPEAVRSSPVHSQAAPRTPVEALLAGIWAGVLGLASVGVDDNFFEVGGDSILGIQVVAKALEAGLKLSPRQIFEHQTIARLAAVARPAEEERSARGEEVVGEGPLAPVQHWFFDLDLADPQHFNQSYLLAVSPDPGAGLLEQAWRELLRHHDALRLRLVPQGLAWRQVWPPSAEEVPFQQVDLSALPEAERTRALEAAAELAQASLDLEAGPLLRVVLFGYGPGVPGRLLMVIHHLAVDGVSWRILLEDLDDACRRLLRGERVELRARTTSYKEWAERLAEHARSAELRQEAQHWLSDRYRQSVPLPRDQARGSNRGAAACRLTLELGEEETRALLHKVPEVYRAGIDDALLTALALVLERWAGAGPVLVDVEGHGREELFEGLDLSRSVGWFTSIHPVALRPDPSGPGAALRSVKEQVRRIPRRGAGFNLLRFLGNDRALVRSLRELPRAEVSFNYLGQFDGTLSALTLFRPAQEARGPHGSPRDERPYVLEILGSVVEGRLRITWIYSSAIHRRETIEERLEGFMAELRALIEHCRSPQAGGYVPSDFPLAALGREQLDRLLGNDPGVEDLYPLSPLQQGLLFHSLLQPELGQYVEQLTCRLEGSLDLGLFQKAWRESARRHPVLRTSFHWEGLEQPLQAVHRTAEPSWELMDWRGLDGEACARRLEDLLEEDCGRGFELSRAPLMRMTAVQVEPLAWRFLWTFHHLLLDGWSLPILLREVFDTYEALCGGREDRRPPARPYRDYIAWLQRQDLSRAEGYWRRELAGFEAPTPVGSGGPPRDLPGEKGLDEESLAIPIHRLQQLARRHRVTPGTLVQGAWAMLLSRHGGRRDVVFGITISGRAADLEGLDSMVGLFINTLPLRVRVAADERLAGWLAELQRRQLEVQAYGYSPLAQVQLWSEVPGGQPLFESILVFANHPAGDALRKRGPALAVRDVRTVERTNFPLVLSAMPASGLTLKIDYERRRFGRDEIRRLLGHLGTLLEAMADGDDPRLSDLPLLTPAERRELLALQGASPEEHRREGLVHELFAARAARAPGAEAVVFENRSLSCSELEARANRLARRLREMGVGPEVRVGLFLERSPELVIALLAVLKAGGVCVPFDPACPGPRLAFLLEDARPLAVLTQEAIAARLPERGAPAIVLDAGGPRRDRWSAAPPASAVFPGSLAYAIYTSGSTGVPKAVGVTHEALALHVHAAAELLELSERDRVLVFASPAFDVFLEELLPALIRGAAVVLRSAELWAPEDFLRAAADAGLTVADLPTAYWCQLARSPAVSMPGLALRLVTAGGEAMPAEEARLWLRSPLAGVRLLNAYGPTEGVVTAAVQEVTPASAAGPGVVGIGRPLAGRSAWVVDLDGQLQPVGAAGELCLGGSLLARGYPGRPDLTAERFTPDPFSSVPGSRLYRTGDRALRAADGSLEFLGRIDRQVKVRGYRIEPEEIEAALRSHPGIRDAALVARPDASGSSDLVAYVVAEPQAGLAREELRSFLAERLPAYMVPGVFVPLPALPSTPGGKVDRRALPDSRISSLGAEEARLPPSGELEERIAGIWRELLGREQVGVHENFFDLGGHSLLLIRLLSRLREAFGCKLALVDLFASPTIRLQADRLAEPRGASAAVPARSEPERRPGEIAVIGMAGRFPRAADLESFWRNLRDGVECISFFSREDLEAAGLDPGEAADRVLAGGILEGVDLFDAPFFGMSPREAELLDPQQRLFLEVAWEALEDAGYDPGTYPGLIGVFAGVDHSSYQVLNLASNPELVQAVGRFQAGLGNDKDFLATRTSYKLGLRGPSLNVQTACSTSLVAIHQACQSLLAGESDIVLAGGVSIKLPQRVGYRFQEGGIFSPDGHCRAFDHRARGTVPGDGAGIVVLKRLEDALADGDSIRAVVKGSAINNDGSLKVGYAAPSVDGQAWVVRRALERAGVEPETVSLIEAHGSGTEMGDPIEMAALGKVFGRVDRPGSCAVGSVKTSIGHLDSAAGVAGFIKAVLALERKVLPPSLNFEKPNPQIEFERGPFYVNTRAVEWAAGGHPRRAGVSSLGLGGTNVHVVLEEAPRPAPAPESRPWQLLVLSARSDSALDAATANLAEHLRRSPDVDLADAAWTLQAGRRAFDRRRALVCSSAADAVRALESCDPKRLLAGAGTPGRRPLAFLFPGQGVQYAGMGRELYGEEAVFREELDRCAGILNPLLGLDLRQAIDEGGGALEQTAVAQPALVAFELALARLWMSWGIRPQAMIGHSLGEYAAACLAGVLSLEDALALVAERGRLMQLLPPGAMLAVPLPEPETRSLLDESLSLASLNAPSLCVVSGPEEPVAALEARLAAREIQGMRLRVGPAGHSRQMDALLAPFAERVRRVRLRPPQIPYLSGVSGDWITAAEATDPEHWVRHMRQTARFAPGLEKLLADPRQVLLEIGPGQNLSSVALQHLQPGGEQLALSSLRHPGELGLLRRSEERQPEGAVLLTALARLWLAGVEVDWTAFSGPRRRRIPLPAYPFERKRHWIEPARVRREEPVLANREEVMLPMPEVDSSRSRRRDWILGELRKTFGNLFGIDPGAFDPEASFFELGTDSLLLLQASHNIQGQLGVRVPFRLLLDDIPTLAALADHVDRQLPPEAFAEEAAPPAPAPAAAQALPAAVDGAAPEGLRDIMAFQVEAMGRLFAEQLSFLRQSGLGGGALAAEPPRPAPPAPMGPPPGRQDGSTPAPYVAYQPVRPGASPLTPEQQRHLDALVERLSRRTQGSKHLAQKDRATLADSRASAKFRLLWKEILYPIAVERAAGARVWDVDGNEYVDVTMGFGSLLFGHTPAFLIEALKRQADKGLQIGLQSPLAGRATELIRELTGAERASFFNSGTEAVMSALRLARTITGRSKIAVFAGSYHGFHDEVLVTAAPGGGSRSAAMAPGVVPFVSDTVMVLDYCSPGSIEILAGCIHELAAVLVEPQQSRRPGVFDTRPFLQDLRRLTEEADTPLIFDEIVTGFRMHPGGVQGIYGIRPDMTTYGKCVGAGIPVGIVAGRAKYLDAVDGGAWRYGDASYPQAETTFIAGTYFKHPLNMAPILAVLEHFKEQGPQLQENLNRKAEEMARELDSFFAQEAMPIQVLRMGSLFVFAFTSREVKFPEIFFFHMLENGIYVWEGRSYFLSTAHTDEDIARIIRAAKASSLAMREGGFLPAGPPGPPRERAAAEPLPASIRSVPATEAQQELWNVAWMSADASRAYNEGIKVRLRGRLDLQALREAVQKTVDRHEALRSTFSRLGDLLLVAPRLALEIPLDDLSHLAAGEAGARAREMLQEEADRVFDFRQGPMVRFRILRFREDDHFLTITAHHAMADGLSNGVVVRDIRTFYESAVQGLPVRLPEPTAFSEFVTWQKSRQQEKALEDEAFWLRQLAGCVPGLELPADRPRPPLQTHAGAREVINVGAPALRALKSVCAEQRTTLFVMLLSAFELLLHHLSGQDDIVVGTVAAGQLSMGGHDLVGHCASLLPIRSRIAAGQGFTSHLAGTRASLLDAYEHQDCPFGRLIQKLGIPRDFSRPPLVQAVMNLERGGPEGLRFHDLEAEISANPSRAAKFELLLDMSEYEDRLEVNCDYNTDLFDASTIERWLGELRTLLERIGENPRQSLSELTRGLAAPAQAPLLPMQRWFLETAAADAHHFNLAGLFQVRPGIEAAWLRRAMEAVVRRHDALRTRFEPAPQGWLQIVDRTGDVPFFDVDLSAEPESSRIRTLKARVADLQRILDPESGRIAAAAFFHLGPREPGRFFLAVHHLAADVTSWRLLLQDIETACRQLEHGQEVRLAPATAPVTEWAGHLAELCRSAAMQRELEHWLAGPRHRPVPLPVDHPGESGDHASTRSVVLSLDGEKVRRLREQVSKVHGMQIGEVVLAGLARALAVWTGSRSLVIDLEGHGREDLFAGVDLSRTVGWLTCVYPLVLEMDGLDDPGSLLGAVRSRVRAIPNGGVGHGVLRYLSPDPEVRRRLESLPRAEVSFNHLGWSASGGRREPEAVLAPAGESIGASWSPRLRRSHLLEVESSIVNEELRLKLQYGENVHLRSTVQELAREVLASLEGFLVLPGPWTAESRSSADFPAAKLSPEDLESLLREIGS